MFTKRDAGQFEPILKYENGVPHSSGLGALSTVAGSVPWLQNHVRK